MALSLFIDTDQLTVRVLVNTDIAWCVGMV